MRNTRVESHMRNSVTILLVAVLIAGCRDGGTAAVRALQHDAFEGEWRSVTPQLEFVRLTVHSLSSEQGSLGARLTFSGVYWEGSGRLAGDSLVLSMTVAGDPNAERTVVARIRGSDTLQAQLRPSAGSAMAITFVREGSLPGIRPGG
jgi:hypothetical protein